MYEKLLKKFVPIPKIENFDSFLFVGPHPDDIEVACAPLIAKLVEQNKRIKFVIVTDGRIGTTNPDLVGEKLVEIRKNEVFESAKTLGVKEISFLGYPDGGRYDVFDVAKAIGAEIVAFKPDVVFAPDMKTRAEAHPDHLSVGSAAATAFMMSGFCGWTKDFADEQTHSAKALALYFTDKPNSFVKIGKYSGAREKCLNCYKSQFDKDGVSSLLMYFKLRETALGLRRFSGKCDGYRVCAPMHLHCIPEASKW